VTSYRLIRCSLAHALATAVKMDDPIWIDRHHEGRSADLHGYSSLPAHDIAWRLKIEQSANGVIAHLSAEPTRGPLTRLSRRWRSLVLQPWSARHLAELEERATPSDAW